MMRSWMGVATCMICKSKHDQHVRLEQEFFACLHVDDCATYHQPVSGGTHFAPSDKSSNKVSNMGGNPHQTGNCISRFEPRPVYASSELQSRQSSQH